MFLGTRDDAERAFTQRSGNRQEKVRWAVCRSRWTLEVIHRKSLLWLQGGPVSSFQGRVITKVAEYLRDNAQYSSFLSQANQRYH